MVTIRRCKIFIRLNDHIRHKRYYFYQNCIKMHVAKSKTIAFLTYTLQLSFTKRGASTQNDIAEISEDDEGGHPLSMAQSFQRYSLNYYLVH